MRILAYLKRWFGNPLKPYYGLIQSGAHFFILLLIVLIDPFGFAETTDARSRDAFYQMTAPFYPRPEKDGLPHEPISVILIDDPSIKSNQSAEDEESVESDTRLETGRFSWPVSFKTYERLLSTIATYGPEAVFFDLFFFDARGNEDDRLFFAEQIKAYAKTFKHFPIISLGTDRACANQPECEAISTSILPEIRSSVTDVDAQTPELDMPFASFTGYGDNYPMFIETSKKTLFSPAASLLKLLCENKSPNCPAELRSLPKPIENSIPEVVSLRWPDGNSHFNQTHYNNARSASNAKKSGDPACSNSAKALSEKLGRSLNYLLAALSERFESNALVNCFYHPYLSAYKVLELGMVSGSVGSKGAQSEQDKQNQSKLEEAYGTPDEAGAELRSFIKGKTVLIGTALTGIPDEIISPVHGRIPGVFLHAMALDNALRFDDEMQRPAGQIFWEADWTDTIEIIGLLLLILIRWYADKRKIAHPPASVWNHYLYFFAAATACLIIFPAIIAITFVWLHWTPINWLGLLSLGWAYLLLCFGSTLGASKAKENVSP